MSSNNNMVLPYSDNRDLSDGISRGGIIIRYVSAVARKANVLMKTLRPMAYASEVGESFRPLVPVKYVNTMYGLSFFYVGGDVTLKCYNIGDSPRSHIGYMAFDQTLWHGMASLAFPGLTIHTIVHQTQKHITPKIINKIPKYGKYTSLIIGLGCIPFIIHPLDLAADFIMNNSFRKYWYGNKIDIPGHEH